MGNTTLDRFDIEELIHLSGVNVDEIKEFIGLVEESDPDLYVQSYCLYTSPEHRNTIADLNKMDSFLLAAFWLLTLNDFDKGGIDEHDLDKSQKIIKRTDLDFRVSCSCLRMEEHGFITIKKEKGKSWEMDLTEKGKEHFNKDIKSVIMPEIQKEEEE